MRLMKMMDYDFKVANYWQYNVSEVIAYKSCWANPKVGESKVIPYFLNLDYAD
jgi:hypothetical protein